MGPDTCAGQEIVSVKLMRWAVAGASVYAVYKYSIGRKAKGEDVFVSPEKEIARLEAGEDAVETAPAQPARKPARKPRAKGPAKK